MAEKLVINLKKLLGNTWYYDCFPVEWRKEKRWGREGGWTLTLTVGKAFPAQAQLSQGPQPTGEHPESKIGTAAPTADSPEAAGRDCLK